MIRDAYRAAHKPETEQFVLPFKKSRADQIFSAFKTFHRTNPIVWRLFEQFTLDLIRAGRGNYSSNAIFERIRWQIDVDLVIAEEIKLNNNFRAYYARLFHVAHPEHDGFFRNRKRTSEQQDASDHDRQEFVGPPPGMEDADLARKLLDLVP